MRRHASVLITVALLLAAAPASAAEVSDYDRFQLWNDCKSTRLIVEDMSDDATSIGLTSDAIEVAVRSRLRAARIYSEDYVETEFTYLYANVNVVGRAFSTSIKYQKFVFDQASMLEYTAPTWYLDATGTHSRDSNYILSWVAQLTDEFIDEYLRVNAEACE